MDGISSLVTSGDEEGEGSAQEEENPGGKQVVVLGASNLPWELDEAFRRRLEKRIYIPLPDVEGRKALIRIAMEGVNMAEDVDIDKVANALSGYSGADIANVCRDAAMMSMRRMMEEVRKQGLPLEEMKKLIETEKDKANSPVTQEDFDHALKKVRGHHVRPFHSLALTYKGSTSGVEIGRRAGSETVPTVDGRIRIKVARNNRTAPPRIFMKVHCG
eukprot:gb/GECG01006378.1/.p1 GENE.gb/GECG01006378.1/~~gb/GECG01006378.1/.p1  ORF type:complete len:217 (+),score=36.12 gb/GECG01006378.1/:1-651(+)